MKKYFSFIFFIYFYNNTSSIITTEHMTQYLQQIKNIESIMDIIYISHALFFPKNGSHSQQADLNNKIYLLTTNFHNSKKNERKLLYFIHILGITSLSFYCISRISDFSQKLYYSFFKKKEQKKYNLTNINKINQEAIYYETLLTTIDNIFIQKELINKLKKITHQKKINHFIIYGKKGIGQKYFLEELPKKIFSLVQDKKFFVFQDIFTIDKESIFLREELNQAEKDDPTFFTEIISLAKKNKNNLYIVLLQEGEILFEPGPHKQYSHIESFLELIKSNNLCNIVIISTMVNKPSLSEGMNNFFCIEMKTITKVSSIAHFYYKELQNIDNIHNINISSRIDKNILKEKINDDLTFQNNKNNNLPNSAIIINNIITKSLNKAYSELFFTFNGIKQDIYYILLFLEASYDDQQKLYKEIVTQFPFKKNTLTYILSSLFKKK